MTAQRSTAPMKATRRRGASVGSSGLTLAVTSAAIPAVVLSSVALAQPATAAPSGQVAPIARQLSGPAIGTGVAAPARAIVPAALVASLVPTQRVVVTAQAVPAEYTVKAGDTISAIAKRHGLSTNEVLSLNGLNARTIIRPGQKIKLTGSPAPTGAPAPTAPAPAPAPSGDAYVVKSGDTLGAIAARNNVSLQTLLTSNNLSMTSIIHPGQKLTLTGPVTTQSTPPTAQQPAPAPAAPAAGSYTVKPGDTLGAIASRNGVSLQDLLSANQLSRTTVIHPGQKLSLTVQGQGGGTPVTPAPTPAPAPAPAPTNLVPSTFLGYQYPDRVVADANANKALLNSLPAPSVPEMKQIVADTARSMGVDPSLALAFAFQESSFNQRAVSPANAIGTMQVIPSSGQWASDLVGRKLNLLDPYDNATAGVAIIRSLLRTSPSQDIAIASYYQGAYSVRTRGMFEDTKRYVAAITSHQANFR